MALATDFIPENSGKVDNTHESLQIEWKLETLPERRIGMLIFPRYLLSNRSPIFQYAGITWRLVMSTMCCDRDGERCMYLTGKGNGHPFPIEYKFGFKMLNGEVETLGSGVMKEQAVTGSHNVEKILYFFQRKKELYTTLTFVCTLKRGIASSDKKIESLDTLSEHFKTLLTNEDSCDISLHVDGKPFRAHRIVLRARSSVFAAMFKHDTPEKQTGVVNITDCDPDTFHDFLEFLYTGKLDLKSCHQAIHLYKTSDKYDVKELKTFCVKWLLRCLTVPYPMRVLSYSVSIPVKNFCFIAQFADRYEETDLLYGVQRFFKRYMSQILDSAEWQSLMISDSHSAIQILKNMSS